MQREPMYLVYAWDPRSGYTRFEFWDLKNARAGCDELLAKYPDAGYKITKRDGRVIRRVNYR